MGSPWQFIEAVQGVNGLGVTTSVPTHTATKNGGADGVFDAEAKSVQTIAGDGYVEWRANGVTHNYALGLNGSDTSDSYTDIDFAIMIDNGGGHRVFESGVLKATDAHVDGDIFRVERIGTTIRYYKNNEHLYTSIQVGGGTVGPLFIDSSFAKAASIAADIRLFDGTSKTWPALTWTVVNVVMSAGAALATRRRMTFAAPTKMVPGDHLVALLASQGSEFVAAADVSWAFVDRVASASNARGLLIERRIVTTDEPAAYVFDLAVRQELIGALLVYRGLDNTAALVGGSGVDFSATTVAPCPARTMTRVSDLYAALVLLVNPGAVTVTPPSECTERTEFSQSALGIVTLRLEISDIAPEIVSSRGPMTATLSANGAGAAFSIALAGSPIPIASVLALGGAIGLPVEGI